MSFLANKVLDNGTLVTNKVDSINFSSNLTVTDNGNGAITVTGAAGGDPDQNLWSTFNADAGSTTANTITDTLTIAGGTGVSTSISGDTLTITNDAPNIPLAVAEDGVTLQTNTTTVNFAGNVDVVDDGGGQVTVNVQNTIGNNLGSLFILPFGTDGPARGTWLDLYFNNILSNDVWGVVPWDCNLVGISFTNSNTGSSFGIDVYRLPNGTTPGVSEVVAYSWNITNARTGSLTNFTTFPAFSAGDGVALYIRDNGNDARDLVVTLYFQINSTTLQTITQNQSGTLTV